VSYVELAAFVSTATADVKNPNMRPHVFSRGPGGHDNLPIVADVGSGARSATVDPAIGSGGAVRTLRLADASPLRIRLVDRQGIPFLDANAEAGSALELTLPEVWAAGAVLQRNTTTAGDAPATYAIPDAPQALTLAALEPIEARGAVRGPAEIFRALFSRPFGPRALRAYQASNRAAAPQVFGVTREDSQRMDLLLGQISSSEHGRRMVAGTYFVGAGAVFSGLGVSFLTLDRKSLGLTQSAANVSGGVYFGLGALALGSGIYTFASEWDGERLAADYRAALAGGDYAHAFALAEQRIDELARSEARQRWYQRISGAVLVLGAGALIVNEEISEPSASTRLTTRAIGGVGMLMGATAIATSYFVESPTTRLATIWRRDPGMLRLQPMVAPTKDGALFGVFGTF
jgi:hypothetical protein